MPGFPASLPALGAALLLALAAPLHAQGRAAATAADTTMSPAARAYLAAALDSMLALSRHRATAPWTQVRDSAFLLAAGARTAAETYGAIQWALKRADAHSFLQARTGGVRADLLPGGVGYVRIPVYVGPARAPLADSLQAALRELEGRGACGWIVDLRMNGGGNVWPMQTGIAPLLGDSVLGLDFVDGRPAGRTVYVRGEAIAVGPDGRREVMSGVAEPYVMRRPGAPVAVLIDGATASSAEAVALAFRTRPRTRFFGARTTGRASVNRGVSLPDGATMVVTVRPMFDRSGREYPDGVEPDEPVAMPPGVFPSPVDAVARRAAGWLATQGGCAAR